jgi:hypothetical protein
MTIKVTPIEPIVVIAQIITASEIGTSNFNIGVANINNIERIEAMTRNRKLFIRRV